MSPTITQQVRTVSTSVEVATRAAEFGTAARLLMQARGDYHAAGRIAEAQGLRPIAEYFQKAAVAPLATSDTGLAQAAPTAAAFLSSLRSVGAFDRIAADAKRVPPISRAVVITGSTAATVHGEGMLKPLTSMALAGYTLSQLVTVAVVAMSDELLRLASPQFFQNELTSAVAKSTDEKFLAVITAGLTPIASAGATSNQILQDVTRLLSAIDTDSASRVFVLAQPATMKAMATKTTAATGELAFPTLTINGGTLAGVTFLASDGVPSGQMIGVDANALAVDVGSADVRSIRQGSLQFSDAPDSPPVAATLLKNLWQHGLQALAVHRTFAVQLLRATGAAMVDTINYQTGNSPA